MRNRSWVIQIAFFISLAASTAQADMTWRVPSGLPLNALPHSVTWGNSQFVAVGFGGLALTSPDGIVWSLHSTGQGANDRLSQIVWNGNQYLAVGEKAAQPSPVPTALTSPDGRNWTIHSPGGGGNRIRAAVWNDTLNYYIATGDFNNGSSIWRWFSLDGAVWVTGFISGVTESTSDLLWHPDRFIAVGGNGLIITSPDGFFWTRQNSGTAENLHGIAYGRGVYVAVGVNGTVLTSPDAVTWTSRTSGVTNTLLDIDWNGSIFVTVGSGSTCCILSSPDAINWHRETNPTAWGYEDVVWNGTRWVAVGGFNDIEYIAYSDDTTPVQLQSFTVE